MVLQFGRHSSGVDGLIQILSGWKQQVEPVEEAWRETFFKFRSENVDCCLLISCLFVMLLSDCDGNCAVTTEPLALKQDLGPFRCGEFAWWSFLLLCGFPLWVQVNWTGSTPFIYYVSVYTDEYSKQPRVIMPNARWDGDIIEVGHILKCSLSVMFRANKLYYVIMSELSPE